MNKYLEYMNDLIMEHYPLCTFIVKCVVVTTCISFLFESHCPKYHFMDYDHRCNLITGEHQYYDRLSGPNWR